MRNANIDSEIRSRIDSFLAELSTLVKSAAIDSVRAALGEGNGVAAPRRGPGRPAMAAGSSATPVRRGGKRSSEDVQKTGEALLAYVQANPGQGVEGIAKGMGVSSKELKLPVIKLIDAGSLRSEGQRRGTNYFPGGGAAKGGGKRGKKAGKSRG